MTHDGSRTTRSEGVAANAGPVALQIEDVCLSYGNVAALKDVALSVRPGEFIAMLGPSGCGKTSLLRSIAGFHTPQKGRIVLNGQNVAGLPPRVRNIGIVFQNYALFPHMTALENVSFGLECRKLPRPRVRELALAALERVRLGDLADRRPKELSGGQQQRVARARS